MANLQYDCGFFRFLRLSWLMSLWRNKLNFPNMPVIGTFFCLYFFNKLYSYIIIYILHYMPLCSFSIELFSTPMVGIITRYCIGLENFILRCDLIFVRRTFTIVWKIKYIQLLDTHTNPFCIYFTCLWDVNQCIFLTVHYVWNYGNMEFEQEIKHELLLLLTVFI